ncbi:lytic transglycosylase domain-containing protein [Mitsuaria sp. GD03876]|uniref:lytic transglycosylase domain-containing protein n=1 Tax=Mitsuaria sp. GD03876 TaxID=2975399 RepID=UPI0024483678|nr:lytic transglycosylase domain-containing protein [Mitsuaria sp. GD03876]MDH0867278.1 lytic transglycosylase domain-containing protein [Mitsuaria sp. GD03876]
MRRPLLLLVLSLAPLVGHASPGRSPARTRAPLSAPAPARFDRCFLAAGQRYGVSPLLLKAIARQESGLDPAARHRNADGSTDTGLMQINSAWLPTLARHGVRESDLQDPCANILVGAWILGSNFRTMGPTVQALGAYNARDPAKRQAYARQVLRHYAALRDALSPPVR